MLTQVSPFPPLMYHLCVCSGVTLRCHLTDHPQAHRHGCLLPACTTSGFVFHTGLSFLQEVSPSRYIYYLVLTIQAPGFPCLYRGLADSSRFGIKILSGKRWAFFSYIGFQVFKSFLQTFHVLIGIHSQTSNKSASCFSAALAVIGSRGPQSRASLR